MRNSISSHATLSDRIEASFGTREELTRIGLLTALGDCLCSPLCF